MGETYNKNLLLRNQFARKAVTCVKASPASVFFSVFFYKLASRKLIGQKTVTCVEASMHRSIV